VRAIPFVVAAPPGLIDPITVPLPVAGGLAA
jgi:hypothetical protein